MYVWKSIGIIDEASLRAVTREALIDLTCAETDGTLQMTGVVGEKLWHTRRFAEGTWQPSFGLVEGAVHA